MTSNYVNDQNICNIRKIVLINNFTNTKYSKLVEINSFNDGNDGTTVALAW